MRQNVHRVKITKPRILLFRAECPGWHGISIQERKGLKKQDMKTTVYKSLLAVCAFGASMLSASGQVLPAAASLSGHAVTVNSSAAYLELENTISTLGAQLHDAFVDHPNLQYRPAYDNNGEIIGYVVTGAGSGKEANKISQLLVELDALGQIAGTVDTQYLPLSKTERVSKRDSRN